MFLYIPLASPRGVNGAAAAAWEEMAALLPGTDKVAGINAGVAGVKDGESTFRLFLMLANAMSEYAFKCDDRD
jgi:hypothetical protein